MPKYYDYPSTAAKLRDGYGADGLPFRKSDGQCWWYGRWARHPASMPLLSRTERQVQCVGVAGILLARRDAYCSLAHSVGGLRRALRHCLK